MVRVSSLLAAFLAVFALAVDGTALAQPKDHKEKERKEQGDTKGKQDGKQQKVKQHKHHNGKDLVGEKVKQNGRHKLHENGKFTSYVDVSNGKVAGVSVKHAEKGDVPVKKYKTTKKMAQAPVDGIQPVSLILAQASGTQYLGMTYIGYAYIDDWGDEVIYWFPYDMVLDTDTGAVEYIPAT